MTNYFLYSMIKLVNHPRGADMNKYSNAILFYNENSGQSDIVHHIKAIQDHFSKMNISLEIVNIIESIKDIDSIIQDAIINNVDLFIAAGGDGTVSLIASPLVGTDKPLGILPIGTGNLLAKELKIPLSIENALSVITSPNSERFELDTFTLNGQHYLLNVSAGVTPKIMANTPSEAKKRFGFFAYLVNFTQQLLGMKLERFNIDFDNHQETLLASEIIITNGRYMGVEPLEWADDIAINDGKLDIMIIRATNIIDILNLVISVFSKKKRINTVIKSMAFTDYCRIETPSPLVVQADGDLVGKTPIEICIKSKSLTIIVPNKESIKNTN